MRASWGDRGGQEVSDSCGPAGRSVAISSGSGLGHSPWAMLVMLCYAMLMLCWWIVGFAVLRLCPTTPTTPPDLSQARQRRAPAARPRLPCDPSALWGHTEATDKRPQMRFSLLDRACDTGNSAGKRTDAAAKRDGTRCERQ